MRTVFCLLLLTATPTLKAEDPAPDFEAVTVFEAGKEGYPVYRIPAIVRTANNHLLAFCEARQGGDASEIDLVMKRSTDGGASWSKLRVLLDSEDFQDLYPDGQTAITVGNPVPIVDHLGRGGGKIALLFTIENDRVFCIRSEDHGETWTEPIEITAEVKKPKWGWYATGPVHGIQLMSGDFAGRFIAPADHRLGDGGADRGPNGAQLLYSDDLGGTWKLGAIDDTYADGLNANETTVVELADGRIAVNTRDQNGPAPGTRGIAYSSDGGESFDPTDDGKYRTFVPAPKILDPPVVQCALLRAELPQIKNGTSLILFSGPDENGPSGRGRSDLRIRYSTDETHTWQDGPLIHVGPAAYSDMVRTGKHQYGVLFECGDSGKSPYSRIDFVPFQRSDVVGESDRR